MPIQSNLPFRPALDDALERGFILLQRDLAGRFIQVGVRLHKHLPRLLVLENHIPHRGAPVLQPDRRHVGEELGARLDIGRRLVDVELLKKVRNGWWSFVSAIRGLLPRKTHLSCRWSGSWTGQAGSRGRTGPRSCIPTCRNRPRLRGMTGGRQQTCSHHQTLGPITLRIAKRAWQ